MTLERNWDLQKQLFAFISAAVAPIPVTAAPKRGLPRYVRIDGWGIGNPELFKNHDVGNHRFFVHVFDAPPGGTDSLEWTKTLMSQINTALRGFPLSSGQGIIMEEAQATFDLRSDENHDAHGFVRYRIQLGEQQ